MLSMIFGDSKKAAAEEEERNRRWQEKFDGLSAHVRMVEEELEARKSEFQQFQKQLRDIKGVSEKNSSDIIRVNKEVSLAKSQFQTHADKIREASMRTDQDFEKKFPSLSHASDAKRAQAAGQLLISKKKTNVAHFTGKIKTYEFPFNKRSIIRNDYRNAHGGYDQVARILEMAPPRNSNPWKWNRNFWQPSRNQAEEKTILIVGATGSGKSTLINAMVNFVLNVRYEDNHRFEVVVLSEAEKRKQNNQALSQTDDITIYKIPHLEGGNIPFALNIIDTPGVCDTRGIAQDKALLPKLKTVFSPKNKHVTSLDAICFVSHAGRARLTDDQRYSFDRIVTSFGLDMANNIIGLFTFDDGTQPKALDAFQEAEIQLAAHFRFNSQAMLAADQRQQEKVDRSIMLTQEASTCIQYQEFYDNCGALFGTVAGMKSVPTTITAQVMENRYKIEMEMYVLQHVLEEILAKKDVLEQERIALEMYEANAEANKDFTVEVTVAGMDKVDMPQGRYVTNCRVCNFTCHDNCIYANDQDKHMCSAMDGGGSTNAKCTVCQKHCHWSEHSNMPFKFVVTYKTEKRTAADIKAKHEEAMRQKGEQTDVLKHMEDEHKKMTDKFQETVTKIRECIIELDSQALKTASADSASYIQQMIETEQMNQKRGYLARIKLLEKEKKTAELLDKIIKGEEIGGVQCPGIRRERRNIQVQKAKVAEGYVSYDKHRQELMFKYPASIRSNRPEEENNNEILMDALANPGFSPLGQGDDLTNINGTGVLDLQFIADANIAAPDPTNINCTGSLDLQANADANTVNGGGDADPQANSAAGDLTGVNGMDERGDADQEAKSVADPQATAEDSSNVNDSAEHDVDQEAKAGDEDGQGTTDEENAVGVNGETPDSLDTSEGSTEANVSEGSDVSESDTITIGDHADSKPEEGQQETQEEEAAGDGSPGGQRTIQGEKASGDGSPGGERAIQGDEATDYDSAEEFHTSPEEDEESADDESGETDNLERQDGDGDSGGGVALDLASVDVQTLGTCELLAKECLDNDDGTSHTYAEMLDLLGATCKTCADVIGKRVPVENFGDDQKKRELIFALAQICDEATHDDCSNPIRRLVSRINDKDLKVEILLGALDLGV